MRHAIAGTALALLVAGAAFGQAAEPMEFEVASVKPAPPRAPGTGVGTRGCFGGPGSQTPVQYSCTNVTVSMMVVYAYGVKGYQIRPPASEDNNSFNVEAKVAAGTTAEQVKAMLRDLLAKRFKLAFHYEKTEVPGYALVVAMSGLKMKESAPDVPAAEGATAPPAAGVVKDADGFSYFARRNALVVGRANGLTRWVGMNVPVEALSGLGNMITGRPVIDSTGLKGKYDFMLTFSSDSVDGERRAPSPGWEDSGIGSTSAGGLTAFEAFEKQLGLKLEPKKVPFDAFVIDHADKTPVEN